MALLAPGPFAALDHGQLSEIMEARVRRGVDVYMAVYAPTLPFTGGAVQNALAEAEAMADLADSEGAIVIQHPFLSV